VHYQPTLHRKYEFGVEHRQEILVSPCDSELTNACSKSRAQSSQLCKIAIRTKPEHVAGDRQSRSLEQARVRLVTVESNQGMLAQIIQSSWHRVPFQVTPVAVESDVDSSDSFGDQRALCGSDHPDGDVSVAAQQIFIAVR
jgi:hypothetical protein